MKIHHFDGIYQERWGFSWAMLVSGRVNNSDPGTSKAFQKIHPFSKKIREKTNPNALQLKPNHGTFYKLIALEGVLLTNGRTPWLIKGIGYQLLTNHFRSHVGHL